MPDQKRNFSSRTNAFAWFFIFINLGEFFNLALQILGFSILSHKINAPNQSNLVRFYISLNQSGNFIIAQTQFKGIAGIKHNIIAISLQVSIG